MPGLLALFLPLSLGAEPSNYTYNYAFNGDTMASPDPYRAADYLLGTRFGIGAFRDPQGLIIRENRIYICDTGNNRIVLLEADQAGGYTLKAVVSSVLIEGEESPLSGPQDVFEDAAGGVYIADTGNGRILKLDRDWGFLSAIFRPGDETIDPEMDFLPSKLAVDAVGRLYLQALNMNKGLMEFNPRGEFSGFVGAEKVMVNPIDYFWKSIATKAQRESMSLFVPTEYNNLYLDHEGFIYVTNAAFVLIDSDAGTPTDIGTPVKRLTPTGMDILLHNSWNDFIIGDYSRMGGPGAPKGFSRFVDVTALENGAYVCLDQKRGRLFSYDSQGNMLYAFGGIGNREGCFIVPSALDHQGSSLFVLDSMLGSLTRFDLTGYGAAINAAMDEYAAGRYAESGVRWEEVLRMNGNYDLAYIGIGRAAYQQGEYKKAMEYFKIKLSLVNYAAAFQAYRKEWVERNLWIILTVLAVLFAAPPLWRSAARLVKKIQEA
jgi:sugar lactone lactonase YvrE